MSIKHLSNQSVSHIGLVLMVFKNEALVLEAGLAKVIQLGTEFSAEADASPDIVLDYFEFIKELAGESTRPRVSQNHRPQIREEYLDLIQIRRVNNQTRPVMVGSMIKVVRGQTARIGTEARVERIIVGPNWTKFILDDGQYTYDRNVLVRFQDEWHRTDLEGSRAS